MMQLTEREKRTVKLGVVGVTVYLFLFYGRIGLSHLQTRKSEYQQLVQQAEKLKIELLRYETDVLKLEKLRKSFQLNLTETSREKLVSETSAAIQQSAQSNGVNLTMMHESSARPSAAILSSMRLEAEGPIMGVVKFVDGLTRLGFPLILDSVQLSADPKKPGMLKVNLEVMVMDFNQFQPEDKSNA